MTTKTLRASDLLELYNHYSNYMFHEAAESGHDAGASRTAFEAYTAKSDAMGLSIREAEQARAYAWQNHNDLYELWNSHITGAIPTDTIDLEFVTVQ